MATDGLTPPPCNSKIFKKGKGVCHIDGSSNAVERWVKLVAKRARAKVDWHYSGGVANVLHLGDKTSRQRVLNVIEELKGVLDGRILSVDGPALYRGGDTIPEGTIAVDRSFGPIIASNKTGIDLDQIKKFYEPHPGRGGAVVSLPTPINTISN